MIFKGLEVSVRVDASSMLCTGVMEDPLLCCVGVDTVEVEILE
jgi:hypothetical protein